jgi:hypothetical protein
LSGISTSTAPATIPVQRISKKLQVRSPRMHSWCLCSTDRHHSNCCRLKMWQAV